MPRQARSGHHSFSREQNFVPCCDIQCQTLTRHCTTTILKPDNPTGDLFEGGGLFFGNHLGGGGLCGGSFFQVRGFVNFENI